MAELQPTTGKYIGAFVLESVASGLLNNIAATVLANIMITDPSALNTYFIVGAVGTVLIWCGSWIVVYNLFKTLNIKKVFGYLCAIAGLGTFASIAMTQQSYMLMELGADMTVGYLAQFVALIASLYLFRSYYVKKPDRWFD